MPRTPEEALRAMAIWQAQAIALLKRALRHPSVLQETVLDIDDTREVHIEIVAHERMKLILPVEDDDA